MSQNVVVTKQNIFSRLGDSIKGIFVGFLIFLVAFPVLFINEGRAIKTHRALKEGASVTVSVPNNAVNPSNEGKLVHVVAPVAVSEALVDPTFGVSVENAVGLRRVVEMFQWVEESKSETREKIGGSTETVTTYSYRQEWRDRVIDSSRFNTPAGHQNPSALPVESQELRPAKAAFGAFELRENVLSKFTDYQTIQLAGDALDRIPESTRANLKLADGKFYRGNDPATPATGDVRIRYEQVPAVESTIVGRQFGNSFESYTTSNGRSVFFVQTGNVSKESIFESAMAGNTGLTWALRFLGFFLMAFGIGLIFRPLSVIASVLPIAAKIVDAGTNAIAFLIAAPLSLLTIAVGWLFYRPLIGLPLVIAAGVGIFFLIKKLREAKATAPAAPVAPVA